MNYKLIALDIDGTLTNSQKEITPRTFQKLMEFRKKGGKIALASGRPTMGMMPYAEKLKLKEYGGYMLSFNGGCVIDCMREEILFQNKFPLEYIPEILEIIKDYPVAINTYENENIIVGGKINQYTELEARINKMSIKQVPDFSEYVQFDINKCLLHGEPEYILELEKILSEKYKNKLGVFKSQPFFLELVPNGIDKAASIDKLIKRIGIKTKECIACGDGFNDMSMIKYAGLGVAMANAAEPVKNIADFITLSNDEDGIAYLLEQLETASLKAGA